MSAEFDLAFDRWVSALGDAAVRRDVQRDADAHAVSPRIAVGTVPPPVREGAEPAPGVEDTDRARR